MVESQMWSILMVFWLNPCSVDAMNYWEDGSESIEGASISAAHDINIDWRRRRDCRKPFAMSWTLSVRGPPKWIVLRPSSTATRTNSTTSTTTRRAWRSCAKTTDSWRKRNRSWRVSWRTRASGPIWCWTWRAKFSTTSRSWTICWWRRRPTRSGSRSWSRRTPTGSYAPKIVWVSRPVWWPSSTPSARTTPPPTKTASASKWAPPIYRQNFTFLIQPNQPNQPTNQSIIQSSNQSINQSSNQSSDIKIIELINLIRGWS